MNKGLTWYIVLFATAVLVQVLFMDAIQFSGLVNPYFYVIFILLLPLYVPRYLQLLLGFVLGITIDVFSNTPGIHASAAVFMSFLRPFFINSTNVDEKDRGKIPSLMNMGTGWFMKYSGVLILSHHIFLFYIEIFTFSNFINTLTRSVLSALFTFVLIVISQFLIFRK
ncbi:MAG TPA: rod shape-determining protein MreD [Prolixibacteraceae bacterium]|nr:rod shape-determining protein MreD [Prolixibacteraceae bacterium]